MKNKVLKNIVCGFGGQLIVLILGIIVPHFMIKGYGSDVNGLLSTVSQIFTYLALLEAGIGQAAKNALYKPIANKDRDGISEVASIARNYYHRLTVYYGLAVLILSVFFPFVIKSNINKLMISEVIFFEGLGQVISFYYIQTITMILSADGRSYIYNGLWVVNRIVSYAVRIIMASYGMNIVLLQIVFCVITILKVVFYQYYFRKNYAWIDFSKAKKNSKFKDRNSYVIAELAWTIFSSTDMIVLSIFISTQMASVYAIYNMVFSHLNVLLNTLYHSLTYLLGKTYHSNIERYVKLHDAFNTLFVALITILMSVAYILIIPFVSLYTHNIADVTYIFPQLPILFCLVQLLSWSRYVAGNLVLIAGYAKQVRIVSIIEAGMNLFLSVLFVHLWGIVGVLRATVIALPLKILYLTFLSDKLILKRSYKRTMSILFGNYFVFLIAVAIDKLLNIEIHDYIEFCLCGIVLVFAFTCISLVVNYMINRDIVKDIKVHLFPKLGHE